MNVLHIIGTVDPKIKINESLKMLHENEEFASSFETVEYSENVSHLNSMQDLNSLVSKLSKRALSCLRLKNIDEDCIADRVISYVPGKFLDESMICLKIVFMKSDP